MIRFSVVVVSTAALTLVGIRFGAYYLRERDPVVVIPYETDDLWTRHRFVAHALGGYGGEAYSNSREAFLASHEAGFRLFEVDLSRTADGVLVASHDWGGGDPPTLKTFLSSPGPTRLTARDVIKLIASHPDTYIILDIKERFSESLTEWVAMAPRDVLDRTIPQLYRERDLAAALDIYPFRSFIYTLYRSRSPHWAVSRFLNRSRVPVLVLSQMRYRFARRLARSFDGYTYVHTVNSRAAVEAYLREGVHGVYTDFLRPDKLLTERP